MEDKGKAKVQDKHLVAEKARKARGKVVEEMPLEADKGLEAKVDKVANPQLVVTLEAVVERDKALAKVQAKARVLVLVLEKEVKVNLADRAKALEAVRVKAKAKAQAKAENLVNRDKVDNPVNRVKAKENQIILLTPCKISQVIYLKHPSKRNKNRLVRLLVNKPKRILINNLNPALKNVMICLI